jgi:UDP-GlcNAc:undecaprenyl-phosphate/decaprenyl-phosphate GlcNAc-1-phosphate transferase
MPFLFAFGIALVLTPLGQRLGVKMHLVDRPEGDLKIHETPVSVLGGVAVIVSAVVAATAFAGLPSPYLVVAMSGVLVAGTIDDVRPIEPSVRVALLLLFGSLATFAWSGSSAWPSLAIVAVPVILATANAVNLVDGQDGLAGGLAAIAALGLAWVSYLAGLTDGAGMGVSLAGALLGFLIWNRPPARIYLGNGGAYSVGMLLALLAVDLIVLDGWRGLLAAGACLGVFGFELAFTLGRRAKSGKAIISGDRLHSYDILARRFRGRMAVTASFWAVGIGMATFGVVLWMVPFHAAVVLAGVGLAFGGWMALRLWPATRG